MVRPGWLEGWVGLVSHPVAQSLDHSVGSRSDMLAGGCWENCVNGRTDVKDLL